MKSFILPVAMSSALAVMVTILAAVLFLFYRKRKLEKSTENVLEPMTRAKEGNSFKRGSSKRGRKNNAIAEKQVCDPYCYNQHIEAYLIGGWGSGLSHPWN